MLPGGAGGGLEGERLGGGLWHRKGHTDLQSVLMLGLGRGMHPCIDKGTEVHAHKLQRCGVRGPCTTAEPTVVEGGTVVTAACR